MHYSLLDTSALTNVSEPLAAVAKKLSEDQALRKTLSTVTRGDAALADVGELCKALRETTASTEAEALEKALRAVVLQPGTHDTCRAAEQGQPSDIQQRRSSQWRQRVLLPLDKARAGEIVGRCARVPERVHGVGHQIYWMGQGCTRRNACRPEPAASPYPANGGSQLEMTNVLLPIALAQLQRAFSKKSRAASWASGSKSVLANRLGLASKSDLEADRLWQANRLWKADRIRRRVEARQGIAFIRSR